MPNVQEPFLFLNTFIKSTGSLTQQPDSLQPREPRKPPMARTFALLSVKEPEIQSISNLKDDLLSM